MPVTGKRRRTRRVLPDRARPTEPKPLFPKAPPEKRLVRTVITAVFFVASVLLVIHGDVGVRLTVADKATRDYRARVAFDVEDVEATRQNQNRMANRALRVFNDRSEQLVHLERQIFLFLRSVADQGTHQTLPAVAKDRWGLSPEQFEALKMGLTAERLTDIEAKMRSAFDELRKRRVWAEETLRREIDNNRLMVSVYDGVTQEVQSASIYDVLALPEEVRYVFIEKLEGVAGENDPPALRDVLVDLATHRIGPTLELNSALTERAEKAARDRVSTVHKHFAAGDRILDRGETVTEQALLEVRKEDEMYRDLHPPSLGARATRIGSAALTIAILMVTAGAFFSRFRRDIMRSNTLFFRVGFVCILTLTAAKIILITGAPPYIIPLSFGAIVLTIACGPAFSLGMSTMVAIMIWMMSGMNFALAASLLIGSATGIVVQQSPRNRTDLIKVGFMVGLAQGVSVWAFALQEGDLTKALVVEITENSLLAFGGGLGVGLIITALLPFIERMFGVVTDMILQEWSDQNQPVLRKMVLDAPGTYHHSIVVGTLAEAAAEAIGANALLTRAASFLHDVGKLVRPEYFIENTGDDAGSRHDGLSPRMSGLIITAHTKDGVEVAKQYGVPKPIRDIIEQHHGTTVVEYFHNRALDQAGEDEVVSRDSFRYRGPEPLSREAAIVLIADAVESASRVLSSPTPARVNDLVRQIIQKRMLDGQLDESGLTLTDLKNIEDSLTRTVTAVLHRRIKYPGQNP